MMKPSTSTLMAAALLAAVVVQPLNAQRRGSSTSVHERGRRPLVLSLQDDFERLAEQMALDEQQRSQIQSMVADFTAEHAASLDQLRTLQDSLRRMQRGPRHSEDNDARETMAEYADLLHDLNPAFREFREDLGDVLTWNQGRVLFSGRGMMAQRGRHGLDGMPHGVNRRHSGRRFDRMPFGARMRNAPPGHRHRD